MSEPAEVVEQSTEQVQPEPQQQPQEPIGAGGNAWDGDKGKWVDKTPRDDQGRFAKIRESIERSQKRSTFIKAVLEGAVEPDENMDVDTWTAARKAQIATRSYKITPPEFPAEKPAQGANPESDAAEQPLTPEQIKHNAAHQELHTRL